MTIDIAGTLGYFFFELLVPLLFSLSFVVFVWGALLYVIAGGHDEAAREKAKAVMLYGVIVFVVMADIWYAARFVANVLPG
jgi:hypothetical protein